MRIRTLLVPLFALGLGLAVPLASPVAAQRPDETSPRRFAVFVDDYLDHFAARHPSIAAGNGLHAHDASLEDFSAAAVRREIAALRTDSARLARLDSTGFSPDERVDRRILAGVIDGWLLDLVVVQSWRRNPMIYASALADGVHDLMTMESAPADVRARAIIAKLRGTTALVAAARTNITNPPAIFARRGAIMFRGASDMLGHDLGLAFATLRDSLLRRRLLGAAAAARGPLDAYAAELERIAPRATASFAIGGASVAARYRAEELIELSLDTLLAIGERSLRSEQDAFARAARQIDPEHGAADVWREIRADHPAAGHLVAAAESALVDLTAFVRAKRLATIPEAAAVIVASAPPFDLGLASMHSSPPLERRPVRSMYYVTDAQRDWPVERQQGWLEKFNRPTLAIITAHEVMPGHYLHSLYMRQTPGKVRRIWIGLNPFPQPSSGQDGWAHYAEQLVVDEGFHGDDPRYRMAQLSESLTRVCRLLSGIRLHTGAWTVDQAAAFFEQNAYLPVAAARAEAERGSYDPTYGGYFLGKHALLTLREDVRAREGSAFDLRSFHERVMRNGIAPWAAHRALLLPGDSRPLLHE